MAQLANTLLPQYLPPDRAGRTQDDVNPRLIRHYTTQGLLAPPLKEGRGAVYTRHHLLHLLTLRRLMVDGHSAQVLKPLLGPQNDAELEVLLTGDLQVQVQRRNPALDYVERLKAPAGSSHSLTRPGPSPRPRCSPRCPAVLRTTTAG